MTDRGDSHLFLINALFLKRECLESIRCILFLLNLLEEVELVFENQSFFLISFIMSVALNACGVRPNKQVTLQPSSEVISTSAYVPATSTSTPALTPTDWISALLTTTPTMYPLPTFPPDCGTVTLGSAGTQTIDNSQKILVQGTAILCGQIYFSPIDRPKTISVLEAMIDLDTGTIDTDTADIKFCPGAGSDIFYYLCDVNSKLMKAYGLAGEKQGLPTFDDCSGISEPFESTNDNEPEFACVITNSGNVSRIKVERFNPNEALSLEISFITWEK